MADKSEFINYFECRKVNFSENGAVPWFLEEYISDMHKDDPILDIGCGPCALLFGFKEEGFTNLNGIDLDAESVKWGNSHGFCVEMCDVLHYNPQKRFKFISMNHVLEHISKEEIIPTLNHIYENLLDDDGIFYISVPNAQSNTGCYWAYEDFTQKHYLQLEVCSMFCRELEHIILCY